MRISQFPSVALLIALTCCLSLPTIAQEKSPVKQGTNDPFGTEQDPFDAAVEFEHRHDVDLDSMTLELESRKLAHLEILEIALQRANLGYVIQNGRLVFEPLGSENLNVTRVFNVQGLLTTEIDVADLIRLIKVGFAESNLKSLTTIDANRIMVVGTEQQIRKVIVTLGRLASTGQPPTK